MYSDFDMAIMKGDNMGRLIEKQLLNFMIPELVQYATFEDFLANDFIRRKTARLIIVDERKP
jgi:hypothetical protein